MKKMKTVFVIDRAINQATDRVVDESRWVLSGEGRATVKFDGSACLYADGKLWRRFDRKLKKAFSRRLRDGSLSGLDVSMFKDAPEGFVACESRPDPKTGHWPGWVPVSADNPSDRYHIEAFERLDHPVEGVTYELVGPKVQSNPYGLDRHELWQHGSEVVDFAGELSFDALRQWLEAHQVEGLVWHHPDGRRAKLRRKDFGLPWPVLH